MSIEIVAAPPLSPHFRSPRLRWLVRDADGTVVAGGTHWRIAEPELRAWIEARYA